MIRASQDSPCALGKSLFIRLQAGWIRSTCCVYGRHWTSMSVHLW